jgi:hypothetical protein
MTAMLLDFGLRHLLGKKNHHNELGATDTAIDELHSQSEVG